MNPKEKIVEILKGIRPDASDFSDTKLIDNGVLDSFDIVTLLLELNQEFGIDIGIEKITPENFNTVEGIEQLILDTIKEQIG